MDRYVIPLGDYSLLGNVKINNFAFYFGCNAGQWDSIPADVPLGMGKTTIQPASVPS